MRNKHYRSSCNKKVEQNGHISKRIKKFIKAYGKEKDILISTVRVMRHLFYTEDKYDITNY
jgi:translation initiation factor IF-1